LKNIDGRLICEDCRDAFEYEWIILFILI
jgi:hypothetical protein